MGIIECKKCGNLIEQDDIECSVCGAKASSKETAARVKTVRITKIKKEDKTELSAPEKCENSKNKSVVITKGNARDQAKVTVGGVFVFLVVFIGMRVFFFSEDSSSSVSERHAAYASAPATCSAGDIQCLGDRYRSNVLPQCINLIEQQATYSYRWIDGLSNGPKLDEAYIVGVPESVIVYQGRNIEMQNAFGAWSKKHYQCWFDINLQKIVNVVVN